MSIIDKIPLIRALVYRFQRLESHILQVEHENAILAQELIDHRLMLKRERGQKICVVFVCHRPEVWEALRSVYDRLNEDARFELYIVAIPNKKQLPVKGLEHECYETEGAETFWREYGCINGYDYETGEWFDLKTLKPDYVFFQQPYNITRCPEYKSSIVSKYAKICYVSYFTPCGYGDLYDECLPDDFLRDVSYFFSQNTMDDEHVKNRVKGGITKVLLTGYPKYDFVKDYKGLSKERDSKDHGFDIIWTPRWTTNEGYCNFFDYKDKLVSLCEDNPDINLIFRPHPQAFLEWKSTGEFTQEEIDRYLKLYETHSNMQIDRSKNYYPVIYSSDCLLTDLSSIVYDYIITGKPVIFCVKKDMDLYYSDIRDGLYIARSWKEVVDTINMLKGGNDPLRSVREQIISERMCISDEGAGTRIARIIAEESGENNHEKY